jgi:hypothetical protein
MATGARVADCGTAWSRFGWRVNGSTARFASASARIAQASIRPGFDDASAIGELTML